MEIENDKQIRRLRKKLRQIENLELLGRSLNEEELCKVHKKEAVRLELARLLKSNSEVEEGNDGGDSVGFVSEEINQLEGIVKPNVVNETEMKRVKEPEEGETLEDKKKTREEDTNVKEKTIKKAQDQNTPWTTTSFWIHAFKGHNDTVTSVAINQDYLISASRDTSIRVWDLKSGREVNNLRGHSNFVTSVKIIPRENLPLFTTWPLKPDDCVMLSASLDCNIKFWDVTNGQLLTSIYTFNGITVMDYIGNSSLCAVGTDGGKLEIYDLNSGTTLAVWSTVAHSESVSCLQIVDHRMFSASLDGSIYVWDLNFEPKVTAKPIYKSEDLKTAAGIPVVERPIRSLLVSKSGEKIYFGDEGSNIKVLNWRTGIVRKLANHKSDLGITNALSDSGNLILASSYDLETGISSINVRDTKTEDYIYTLGLRSPNRIVTLSVYENSSEGSLLIASGGTELQIWEAQNMHGRIPSEKCRAVKPVTLNKLSAPAEDSEDEDDCSSENGEDVGTDETENDLGEENPRERSLWCLIL